MSGYKSRIESHNQQISQAYDRLKALNTEMADLFASIDMHSDKIEIEEGKLAEAKRQRNELNKNNNA